MKTDTTPATQLYERIAYDILHMIQLPEAWLRFTDLGPAISLYRTADVILATWQLANEPDRLELKIDLGWHVVFASFWKRVPIASGHVRTTPFGTLEKTDSISVFKRKHIDVAEFAKQSDEYMISAFTELLHIAHRMYTGEEEVNAGGPFYNLEQRERP